MDEPLTPEQRYKAELEAYMKEHEDLMTPSTLMAAYLCPNAGTDLDAIEPFTLELTDIVDRMKEELATEVRILEGLDAPEYAPLPQNELSHAETKEDQWTTDLQNGFSRIGRIPTSTLVSSTSSSSARNNSPVSDIPDCGGRSCLPRTDCCAATLDDYGCETGATSESCECTVPTISEPTPGTPSEAK
jgi:hypothetical protein